MFAYVPNVPGPVLAMVSQIPSPLPDDHNAADYHACSSVVTTDWQFNGYAFTKIPQAQSEPDVIPLSFNAQIALNKSDIAVIRCGAAGIPVPTVWNIYRAALRAIVNGSDITSTLLPSIPTYPSGT